MTCDAAEVTARGFEAGTGRRGVRVGEVVTVLGGASLLTASWVIAAADDVVPEWEAQIFRVVNDAPDVLWPIVWPPMQAGSFVGSIVVSLGALAIARNVRLGAAALISSQVGFWAAKVIKQIVARGRPQALLSEVQLREEAGGLGYISGHATVAFALAAALAPSLPRRWKLVAVAVAVTVAFGRTYAGAHLPLDVVGGAGFGLLLGTLARWAFGLGGEGLPPRPGVDPR